jgi:hypothetical protein
MQTFWILFEFAALKANEKFNFRDHACGERFLPRRTKMFEELDQRSFPAIVDLSIWLLLSWQLA